MQQYTGSMLISYGLFIISLFQYLLSSHSHSTLLLFFVFKLSVASISHHIKFDSKKNGGEKKTDSFLIFLLRFFRQVLVFIGAGVDVIEKPHLRCFRGMNYAQVVCIIWMGSPENRLKYSSRWNVNTNNFPNLNFGLTSLTWILPYEHSVIKSPGLTVFMIIAADLRYKLVAKCDKS